jgi:hypothetical protein
MSTNERAPRTLLEAIRYFADPTVCRDALVAARWPKGVRCPHCGSKEARWLANAGLWKCRTKHPRQKFSVKVGTIFEDSPIGLDKWLPVVWMLVNCKNGISSLEVMRDLGVTQKTAWFMLHRVRLALREGTFTKLGGGGGIVEVDESWIGGAARLMNAKQRQRAMKPEAKKTSNRGKRSFSGKAIVLGMLERGQHGRIRLRHIPNVKRTSLEPHIHEHVWQEARTSTRTRIPATSDSIGVTSPRRSASSTTTIRSSIMPCSTCAGTSTRTRRRTSGRC